MHRDESVLAVGMVEAARRLGLSARTVATLVLRHELPSRKVGRRRIIPVTALEDFVTSGNGLTRAAEAFPKGSGITEG